MVWTCCVRGCKSNAKRHRGVSFFSFPKNKEKEWIEMLKLTNVTITSNIRICSMHFLESDVYMAGSVRKLRKNAEPTIFKEPPKGEQTAKPQETPITDKPFNNQNTFELINVPETPNENNLSYDAILLENRQLKEKLEILKKKNEELSKALSKYKSNYTAALTEKKELKKQLEQAEKSGKSNRTIFFCCNDDCHA